MEDFSKCVSSTVFDHIFVLDKDGRILTINKSWWDVFGNSGVQAGKEGAPQSIGCNYLEICDRATGESSEEAGAMAKGIRAVINGELETFNLEYPCHSLTEQRWFKVRVTRFHGDTGHVMVAHENITEQRRAEIALRESETLLRRSLMLLPEAVLICSGSRISFANEAAQRLFGVGEGALLGCSFLEWVHPDSMALAHARMLALGRGEPVPLVAEMKLSRPDGTHRVVESTAAIIDNQGEALSLTVLHDVTELRQIKTELARAHDDLQRLIAAQESIQENERKRIARELHDDLQQLLAAIKMDVVEIEQRLAVDPASVAPMLSAIDQLATASIVSTRRIVNDLRPQILDGLGLVPALDVLVGQFGKRSGIHCTLNVPCDGDVVMAPSAKIATCLYRVAQEALNNVAKHAQASSVSIRLAAKPGGSFVMRISDNGLGISDGNQRKRGSFGLLGMRERVRALGGFVAISGQKGAGTTLEVCVPCRPVVRCDPGPQALIESREPTWDSLIPG